MLEQRAEGRQTRLRDLEILNGHEGRRTSQVSYTRERTQPRREIKPLYREIQYNQELASQFFEDEIQIVRLLIENAILSGRYTPADSARSTEIKKDTVFVVFPASEKDNTDILQELDGNPVSNLSSDELIGVFEKINGMRNYLSSYLFHTQGVKPQHSEDIISEAILKVWGYAQRGKLGSEYLEGTRLKALMQRAVNFSRIDWFRKRHGATRKVNPQYFFETYISEIEPTSSDYHKLGREDAGLEEVENENENEEYRQYIKYALPQLTEYQRRIVVLKAYFNLTAIEIGQILDKSPNTVKSTHSHALEKLRNILTT